MFGSSRCVALTSAALLLGADACTRTSSRSAAGEVAALTPLDAGPEPAEARTRREALVALLEGGGYASSPRVLAALRQVPRHRFVPEVSLAEAYGDWPLPIGAGQTISQPAVVAEMTEALEPRPGQRVLEIGTGSGYQAAILAVLVGEVYTIEIVPELGERAAKRLGELGYANVHVRVGDGYLGWPEHAPFARIILTAAPPEIPHALLEQLADDGVLVAPVGGEQATQSLVRVRRMGRELTQEQLDSVRFVPMVRGH